MLSARNRELVGLAPSALLVTVGFAAIFLQSAHKPSVASWSYGAEFFGLCLLAHLVGRWAMPDADPYLLPLTAVLSSTGLVMLYRISPHLAAQQAQWFVVGLLVFVATVVALRGDRFRALERYRYTIALAGIGLLLGPRLPVIGQQVNGAYLNIHLGPIAFQPAELTKIAIVVFLASYLRDTRSVLATAGPRLLGVTFPPMKQLGPLLVVWGLAMVMLLVTRELGTSLMFFGVFLALLYVATSRPSFPIVGLIAFGLGAWFVATHVGHVRSRVDAWQHPFDTALYNAPQGSYQLAQGLFAQADGGVFGSGLGASLLKLSGGGTILPVPESDFIYAVLTNELGLAGAAGLIGVYLLFVQRGMKIAMLAPDSFSKLLATGLSFIFALQVFVIVGGVTRVIPLTGVTLPFVAYGGSSVVMNFVLLALLLTVSQRARGSAART